MERGSRSSHNKYLLCFPSRSLQSFIQPRSLSVFCCWDQGFIIEEKAWVAGGGGLMDPDLPHSSSSVSLTKIRTERELKILNDPHGSDLGKRASGEGRTCQTWIQSPPTIYLHQTWRGSRNLGLCFLTSEMQVLVLTPQAVGPVFGATVHSKHSINAHFNGLSLLSPAPFLLG